MKHVCQGFQTPCTCVRKLSFGATVALPSVGLFPGFEIFLDEWAGIDAL